MKNKLKLIFLIITFNFLFQSSIFADELKINAKSININKNTKTVFLKDQVSIVDEKNNYLETTEADYLKEKDFVKTYGYTKVITSGSYNITGTSFIFDNYNGFISSDKPAVIVDKEENKISVQNFYYDKNKSLYSSKGEIKILDKNGNSYFFSEIYIDEKKEKIVGSDIRVFLDNKTLSVNSENDTRIFANTISIADGKSVLGKSILTYCKFRENEKCPPWSIQANKIEHSTATKTVYYENAVLKIYDFPVLYMPKFFHPDPSVKRRSGFLVPSFSKNSNIGSAILAPYFLDISDDKDLTITPHMYVNNNPLLQAEFRQAFRNANLIIDAGYTQGYRKKTPSKTGGSRNHFFSKLDVNLSDDEGIYNNLEINFNHVNNNTYLDIYDLETFLNVNEDNIIDSSVDYSYDNDDFLFNINPHAYKDLSLSDNKRYEYILPVTYKTNLTFGENIGLLSYESNLIAKNFDVDKHSNSFINNLSWQSNLWVGKSGAENQLLSDVKLVNYRSENVKKFKNDQDNTEIYGAVGYLTKLPFFKDHDLKNRSTLTPKMLLRFAPGKISKQESYLDLDYSNIFDLKRMNVDEKMESGTSTTLGFEYKYQEKKEKDSSIVNKDLFSFSAGQIIKDENNNNLPAPINSKASDIVGAVKWSPTEKFSITNNYSIDQSYKEFNSNEIETELDLNKVKFNLSYLEEKNYFLEQEYIQSKININTGQNTALSFGGKRNLLKDSSEYYNLAYEYFNDCLKAGIAYRREFYTDRDIEPKNTLMFTITVKPFGNFDAIEFEEE